MEGYKGAIVYGATKWGVRGFTKGLAKEYRGLLVISVNPDLTSTKMTDFEGRPSSTVADLVLATAEGRHRVESGGDVNVWELVR
jgi:NAD(P)-dependent dehydrogenase (short-subunit alcohol dehydrogenase family)